MIAQGLLAAGSGCPRWSTDAAFNVESLITGFPFIKSSKNREASKGGGHVWSGVSVDPVPTPPPRLLVPDMVLSKVVQSVRVQFFGATANVPSKVKAQNVKR